MSNTHAFTLWLEEQLARAQSGTRLPSGAEVRRVWGISEATLSRLLKRYVDAGRVIRIRRKGSFIGTAGKLHDRAPDVPPTSAERLAAAVRQLVVAGVLRAGANLPSVKYLSAQYRVAPRTAVRAYRILFNQGLIERTGKSFWVSSAAMGAAPRGGSRVALVLRDGDSLGAQLRRSGWGETLRALEEELRLYGYRFEPWALSAFHDSHASWGHLIGEERIAGLVFWGCTAAEAGALAPALAGLDRSWSPATVVEADPQVVYGLSSRVLVAAHTRVYMFGARLLVRQLTISGRRHAAVVSLFADEERRAAIHHGVLHAEGRGLEVSRHDLWAGAPARGVPARTGRNDPAMLGRAWRPALDKLHGAAPRGAVWVFPTQESAAVAVHWARQRGIAVPRELAFVAMSSGAAAVELGISAVDTNWPYIGCLLAHHLVGDFRVPRTERGFLRYGGRFLRRDTF